MLDSDFCEAIFVGGIALALAQFCKLLVLSIHIVLFPSSRTLAGECNGFIPVTNMSISYPRISFSMSLSTPVVQWLSYLPLDPRFVGSIPAGVDGFFQSAKNLSMTSFGREVKPWVPCRRFTPRKEPQTEISASEQNLSDFSRSMSESTLMTRARISTHFQIIKKWKSNFFDDCNTSFTPNVARK